MANPSLQDEDKTPSADGSNRRRQPRKSVIETELVTVDLGQDKGALLLDVSEDGMGVQALSGTHQGATVPVGFELPDTRERVEGTGLVVWNDQGGHVGVLFRDLAASAKARLRRWLSNGLGMPEAAPPPQADSCNAGEAGDLNGLREEVAGLTFDFALTVVADRARVNTGSTGLAVVLSDGADFICRASSGRAPDIGARIQAGAGLSGECLRTGQIVRCEDTETDPRADRIVCRQLSLRSAVILPLQRGAEMVGVLEAFSDQAHAFDSVAVLWLRRVGEIIVSLAASESTISAAQAGPAPEAASAEVPQEKPEAVAASAAPEAAGALAAKPAPEPATAPRPAAPKPETVITPLRPAAAAPIQPQPKPVPLNPQPTPVAAPPLATAASTRATSTPPAVPMASIAPSPAPVAAPVLKPAPASTPPPVAKAVPVAPVAKAAEPTPRAASLTPARVIPEPVPATPKVSRPAPEVVKYETVPKVPERKLEPQARFDDYVPPSLLVKAEPPKKSHLPHVLVMLLVGTAVGGGGWVYYQKWQAGLAARNATTSPVQQPPAISALQATAAPVTTPPAPKTPAPASQQATAPPKTAMPLPAAVRQNVPRKTAQAAPARGPQPPSSPPATPQASANPEPSTPPPVVTTASLTPAQAAPSSIGSNPPSEAAPSPSALTTAVQPAAAQPPLPQPVLPTPAPPSPTPAASPPVRVSQGVTGGQLTRRIEPTYPAAGRALGLQGSVVVHATVNARGTVDKVTVVKGNAILATAAVEAVKRWRYEPFRLNGQPVEMETDITFNFTMPRP